MLERFWEMYFEEVPRMMNMLFLLIIVINIFENYELGILS